MTRSRKKNPIGGNSCAESEKWVLSQRLLLPDSRKGVSGE
jgi:hypothetical protein